MHRHEHHSGLTATIYISYVFQICTNWVLLPAVQVGNLFYSKYPLKNELTAHKLSSPLSAQYPLASLFIRINLHAYGVMGNETVELCCGSWWWCSNEWLSHPWDAVCDCDLQLAADTLGWHNDWRGEDPDKAAPLSCQQGVFELSPAAGWRGEFLEAELRVNSVCRQTTRATSALPHRVALLKCKALLPPFLMKNPVMKNQICSLHH